MLNERNQRQKEYTLYDSIYRKFEGRQNLSTVIESRPVVAWVWGWEEGIEFKGAGGNFGGL